MQIPSFLKNEQFLSTSWHSAKMEENRYVLYLVYSYDQTKNVNIMHVCYRCIVPHSNKDCMNPFLYTQSLPHILKTFTYKIRIFKY